ncbi:MAG: hypothetical protein EKK39_02210 [Sphingobacteriales bacterium]|uniref:hypothetical protein n=1 Tax=Hydrotalea flava TaxID=714549 RepID=UPI000833CBDA|nr:hypothetical protein [Hydrotalea flava]RTL55820.1 MAG: hypothetical protein EKK39_02210 [Sphingobacteriales bacterium]
MKQLILLFICCFIGCKIVIAQINTKGVIIDTLTQQPIRGASVLLVDKKSKIILAFAITDTSGYFTLSNDSMQPHTELAYEIRAIQYIDKIVPFTYFSAYRHVYLWPVQNELPSVTVHHPLPYIDNKTDTLTYRIDAFKSNQDRTIGDVIKKLPGMQIDASGKIFYNGTAIKNFYIDGDNLLEGRYTIASNNIPAEMVNKLQVIQHDEPIKVLQQHNTSNCVSINVEIKKGAKIKPIKQVDAALGINNLHSTQLTMLSFKPAYKAINTLQENNIGIDVATDIVDHNDNLWLTGINYAKNNYLLGLNYEPPALDKFRYLMNKGGIVNANNLWKTKKGIQIRSNIYYWQQDEDQNYANGTSYFLPNDTISYLSQQQNNFRYNSLFGAIQMVVNQKKFYLSSMLNASFSKNNLLSNFTINNNPTFQQLQQQKIEITNRINLIKPVFRNDMFEFNALFQYNSVQENLNLHPGTMDSIFQIGQQAYPIQQNTNAPNFFSYQNIAYRHFRNNISQSLQISFSAQTQQLNSFILLYPNNLPVVNFDSGSNAIKWYQYQYFGSYHLNWLKDKISVDFSLPFNYQQIHFNADYFYSKHIFYKDLFFNPFLRLQYATGAESNIILHFNSNNQAATIQDVFPGLIIRNYLTIQNNLLPFVTKRQQLLHVQFQNKKSIQILFYHVYLEYNRKYNNFLTNTVLFQNFQKNTNIPYANTIEQWQAGFGLSKYFFAIKTNISIESSWQTSNWLQLINLEMNAYKNTFLQTKLKLFKKIRQLFAIDYEGLWAISRSRGIGNLSSFIFNQSSIQQNASVHWFFKYLFDFTIQTDTYYYNQHQQSQTGNYFLDAIIQKNISKLNTKISLGCYNVLNTGSFLNYSINANMKWYNDYTLRPRMLLLKAQFSF